MTVPIPKDSARRRRNALIAASCVVGVLVVSVTAWTLLRPRPTGPSARNFTPAEETTVSPSPPISVEPSAPVGEVATGVAQPGRVPSATVGPAKIAFKLGRSLYVANEDGSGAVAMKNADAVYSLSPDGSTFAAIRGGKLVLEAVAESRTIEVGAAELVAPVWTPDSSAAVVFRVLARSVWPIWGCCSWMNSLNFHKKRSRRCGNRSRMEPSRLAAPEPV